MEEKHYEQVRSLVEQMDYDWGLGPYEEALPDEDRLRKLNELTGRDWSAEEIRDICFLYGSHNSTEETVYFLFHGGYPPVTNVDLVYYRLKPGAALDAKTVYEKYRLGNQMKALAPLPVEEILEALRALPGWKEHKREGSDSVRFDCVKQPDAWSDVHFWIFWYGGQKNPRPDHLLRLSCHNLKEGQIQSLLDVMEGFGIPLQYREEDHSY